MSDPPRDSIADPPAEQTAALIGGNRLSIAHLLLWITTTAVAFGFLQGHSPESSPQKPSGEVERWEFISMLAFAPAYGAAFAGVALTVWRAATWRFGFPTQPGHWLLLLLAVIPAMPMVMALFESVWPLLGIGLPYSTVAAVGAALQTRQPLRWRCVFVLVSAGLALLWLQLGLNALVLDGGPAIFAGLGMLGLGSALLVALGCSALDLTASQRYDFFHWTGVAVLFALLCHVFVVVWGINAGVRG